MGIMLFGSPSAVLSVATKGKKNESNSLPLVNLDNSTLPPALAL